jgi:hypothetical protein
VLGSTAHTDHETISGRGGGGVEHLVSGGEGGGGALKRKERENGLPGT